MMNSGRAFTVTLTLSALGCALFACGAPASGEPAPETTTQPISCMSDGIHIDTTCGGSSGGGIAGPTYQTCSGPHAGLICSDFVTNAAGVYDPVVVPNSGGAYVPSSTFTSMLTGAKCGAERHFQTLEGWQWATAVCPLSVAQSVTAFGEANGNVAGVINPCNPCTQDPLTDQVVVGWLIVQGWTEVCVEDDGGKPICDSPGAGCKTFSCIE